MNINITSAKYHIDYLNPGVNSGIILVSNGQTLYVPLDTNNVHYQAIQEWVKAGNSIEAAD